ncbi:DUF1150 family protein [Ruegeria profundi]|uniref:Uncharacterized protein n=1 Tax=Ruegeria profundi TaxID=1685378 RepID=A0A0X3TV04_9RHOB|nr:DUF1150 family protein [Ruegeria profundi]KUJ79548.1 hypothetical protein AVO44_10085 [Ruegeria profundi]MCA0929144.1 DUF1150 domain-containing protein [Ruegeria profundi]
MNTPIELNTGGDRIAYVKTVEVADLPQEVREQAGDLDQLYAVHNSDGQQLALVADRKLAFVLAREHDFSPVAVH